MSTSLHVKIAVIGGGPGGYTAAFRAADLLQGYENHVAIIEKNNTLGGVCLHTGCIPSKSLLHLASHKKHLHVLAEAGLKNLSFEGWDLELLRAYQSQPIIQLANGLNSLAKKRKILSLTGEASFTSPNTISVLSLDRSSTQIIHFEKCIIAIGSTPTLLPFLPSSPQIFDSTGALSLKFIPERLLIIGAGIIGLEMGQVYSALGSKVTIIEAGSLPIAMADQDLVTPLVQMMIKDGINFWFNATIKSVFINQENLCVAQIQAHDGTIQEHIFEAILQCVGRRPHNQTLNLQAAGLILDPKGFIPVDSQTLLTTCPNIFAIGDCIGDPMLAHKAMAQGKIAAMRACGQEEIFSPRCIPSVVYTDPELAWVGLTEQQLIAHQIPFKKATFPWIANGRALVTRNLPGLTKVLIDPASERILGAGILGTHAGDLIAEMTLAIEMGAVLTDLVLTIHPHPTFSETLALSGEMLNGSIIDLIPSVKSS